MLEFRILGPLEIRHSDSGVVAFGSHKQRALLALLLLHGGRVVPTDRLLDDLWGEQPPPTAQSSLQNLVSQLRKALGRDVVVTKPPGYVLQIDEAQLDLRRFEQLVANAREAEPARRAKLLREALALWRGPPLAEFAFERFAENEIGRLEDLRLAAIEERIEADVELERHAELVGEIETLVAQHPYRERLRGQLMLSLYRSGRQAEALNVYHDTRRALVDELGIEPSRSLQQLYASILRQEAGLEPATPLESVGDQHGEVLKALLSGRLVSVLGPAVNRSPPDEEGNGKPSSQQPGPVLPDGTDVVAYLANCFDLPAGREREVARLSQYVALVQGVGPLYDGLHALFDQDYEPGPVQRTLANVALRLHELGAPPQLIVSTNYDLALERAFTEAGVEFDVVSYVATGRNRGKFLHVGADRAATLVDLPNTYGGIPVDRSVILKLHGQVDRSPEREWESFVVSEDDYIDYLAQSELASVVPVTIAARLRRSHFLFLGYPLQEWRLRVFLHRVWGQEKAAYRSWAVQPRPEALERDFWRQRGVDLFDVPLDAYLSKLERRLEERVREQAPV
jgi:DNA-binding SARP family transcriptional activator